MVDKNILKLENILKQLHNAGLSKTEEEMFVITDEPKIPGYLCFPNKETGEKYDTEESFGQGFDIDITNAKVKAVGELLERLCLYNSDKEFLVSRFTESKKSFADPTSFFCYSAEQTPNSEVVLNEIRSGLYRWWPATNLTTGREEFIPAQMVFLSDIFNDEVPIRRERISTGAALGPIDTEHAFSGGFMESIERDACISTYLKKRIPNKITNLPDSLSELKDYLLRYQLEPHIFDVTTDLGIPTVLVVTLDRTGIGDAVQLGSKASTNYEDAIRSAILESIQCRRAGRIMKHISAPNKLPADDEIISLEKRFIYWSPVERINDLDFLVKSNKLIDYNDLLDNELTLEQAIDSVKSRGFNIYVADITLDKIREQGFEALKVVIPELHPLYLNEQAKSLYSVHHGTIKEEEGLKPHPLT